jgi:TrmH family RNA methyltransferase
MESVTSRQNVVVKTFRGLAARRQRGETGVLLEGEHLVAEALDAGVRIATVAVAARLLTRDGGTSTARIRRLVDRLDRSGARVLSVNETVLAAISPVRTPSGIVGIAEFEPPALDRVFDGDRALVPILVGVQDPGNLGAVVRTAEAAGATGLVACTPSADPFTWKALRGAMGSTFRLPVPERVPAERALAAARGRGLVIAAAVPRGGLPLQEFDFRRPVALLLGGEGGGLEPIQLDRADARVSIPMHSPVESLNVAVSAAVVLYEAARQRAART